MRSLPCYSFHPLPNKARVPPSSIAFIPSVPGRAEARWLGDNVVAGASSANRMRSRAWRGGGVTSSKRSPAQRATHSGSAAAAERTRAGERAPRPLRSPTERGERDQEGKGRGEGRRRRGLKDETREGGREGGHAARDGRTLLVGNACIMTKRSAGRPRRSLARYARP